MILGNLSLSHTLEIAVGPVDWVSRFVNFSKT